MLSKEKVTYDLELDLSEIPKESRKAALNDVGEFIRDSILDYVGEGKSPVKGEGSFKKLNKNYADNQKSGDRLANLDLNGDMLDALDFRTSVTASKITVGIFRKSEAIKAYNHNVGDTLPKRRFIPDESQEFKEEIKRGIKRILQDYGTD